MSNFRKNKSIKESDIDFLSLAKKESSGRIRIRLLALSHIKNGVSHRKTAKMLQVSPVSIQAWVKRFRRSGLEGLKDKLLNKGRKQMLPKGKEGELRELVLKKQKQLTGGRLIGTDIIKIIKEQYGITYRTLT